MVIMALYNETVMEHFMNPHNVGEIDNPDGKGTYGSPVCGDMMQITIKVDDNEKITDAKFKTFGCGSAIAIIQHGYGYDNRNGRRGKLWIFQ